MANVREDRQIEHDVTSTMLLASQQHCWTPGFSLHTHVYRLQLITHHQPLIRRAYSLLSSQKHCGLTPGFSLHTDSCLQIDPYVQLITHHQPLIRGRLQLMHQLHSLRKLAPQCPCIHLVIAHYFGSEKCIECHQTLLSCKGSATDCYALVGEALEAYMYSSGYVCHSNGVVSSSFDCWTSLCLYMWLSVYLQYCDIICVNSYLLPQVNLCCFCTLSCGECSFFLLYLKGFVFWCTVSVGVLCVL